ncbi:MAG: hypothetical protein U0228_20295 [Myxococcaceae bacterium]
MRALVLLAPLLLLSACASQLPQIKKDVGPLAAEAMECPEAQLSFEEMQKVLYTSRVKVKGCGKETQWVLEESRWKKDRSVH